MRIEHLEYLLAVVQYRSMNKAAKALFCSQPAITNVIKSIEDELGYQVIERSMTGAVPTKLGQKVVSESAQIVNFVNEWKKYSKGENLTDNIVQMAYVGTVRRTCLIHVLLLMQEDHPEIKVQLDSCSSTEYHNYLQQGGEKPRHRVTVFSEFPSNIAVVQKNAKENGFRVEKLWETQFGVFARMDNNLMKKDSLLLSDIQGKTIVMHSNPATFPYLHFLDDQGCDYSQQVGDDENVMMTIIAGDYIAIRPMSVANNNYFVQMKIVGCCAFSDVKMPINHYVLYPQDYLITKAENTLVNILRSKYSLPENASTEGNGK
jgi:DNA-binding transcriptional LysR family regulator